MYISPVAGLTPIEGFSHGAATVLLVTLIASSHAPLTWYLRKMSSIPLRTSDQTR